MPPKKTTRFFTVLVAAIRARRRNCHDARLLAGMSERELKDLGMGRSQAPALLLRCPAQALDASV
jgi:uncharacterized protein YjiS (DUF1127 family)